VVAWQKKRFKTYWTKKSARKNPVRKFSRKELRFHVFRMAEQNSWGAPKIYSELLKLGFSEDDISQSTVSRYLPTVPWLQMVSVYFETCEGEIYKISDFESDYQYDVEFEIDVTHVQMIKPWLPDNCSIYWWVEPSYMPVGLISEVGYSLHDDRILSEISFKVGNHCVRIKTGEVFEEDDSFQIVWLDESIMIQVDNRHPTVPPKKDDVIIENLGSLKTVIIVQYHRVVSNLMGNSP